MDEERFEIWQVEASERVDDLREVADSVMERAKDAIGSAGDNPMLMLLGGFAVGFLLGAILPITRFERERLGPVADDLKGRARDAIKESIDAAMEESTTH